MHLKEFEIYRPICAISPKNYKRCFYCGCISTKMDLVPPLKFAYHYLITREEAEFISVPACQECFDSVADDRTSTLVKRSDNVKTKLSRKYRKALRVYEMWGKDELTELDSSLRTSIEAGLKLGEDAYNRVKFPGFDFEVDGEKHSAHYTPNEVFEVFGSKFDNFRDALSYASSSYRIPKNRLKDLFFELGNSFDSAITFVHTETEKKLFEKSLKSKCKSFADLHKQNVKFVVHAVTLYMEDDNTLTIDTALERLYEKRIKKTVVKSIFD
ncbi:hypothetical protein [Vibrio campbellii]|uniref:hypothetical protein n=1 Tax=Vibrio campbellii TaxID=680 RepID=UPI0003A383D3|nr:hypothetical protein [Vibrio campbellii]